MSNLPSAFSSSFWSFLGPSVQNQTNYYRPLQTVTYMVAYQLGGLSPGAYHWMSLLFHIAASLFVYLLCIELLHSPGTSLFAAALFAVHPIHTEAVAWIAGIPDVAAGAFYFAAFWAFLQYKKTRRPMWMGLTSLLFLAALLFKEMAVTLPICLFLVQWLHPEHRRSFGDSIRSLAPFGIVIALYLPARIHALGLVATSQLPISATWLDWIGLAARVFADYIRYAIAPYPLNAFHLLPVHLSDAGFQTVISLVLIATVLTVIILLRTRVLDAVTWFACFAAMLIPVFYFKGISYAFVAERYLYIPSFAMCVLLVSVIIRLAPYRGRIGLWIVIAGFGLMTIYRNQAWVNDEQLYSATLRVQPEASHMRLNLADIYLKRNDDKGAKNLLESAISHLDDRRFMQLPFERYRAHVGLGAIAARAGDFSLARQHFQTAIEIQPNGDWGYLYLGGVYLEADQDYPKAIEHFKKAIELGPLNEVARDYLGIAMLQQGNYEEAVTNFKEALRINPMYEEARIHLMRATGTNMP